MIISRDIHLAEPKPVSARLPHSHQRGHNEMQKRELTDEEALDLLHQEEQYLNDRIGDLDCEIARDLRMHAEGHSNTPQMISHLQSRYETKAEFSFKLGQISIHIDDLTRKIQERGEPSREIDADTRRNTPALAVENHLDWLEIREPAPETQHDGGEWHEPDLDRR
jgi:hypothetical protein